MSRSTWKIPFSRIKFKKGTTIKQESWSRAYVILPAHLGEQLYVHNGKSWIRVQITEQMIGHKCGEFASTRRKTMHRTKVSQRNNHKG